VIEWQKKHKFAETVGDLPQNQYAQFANQQIFRQAGKVL